MIVAVHHRIEMLSPSEGQDLEFFFSHQFLKIAVDRAEADVGQRATHLVVDLVGGRVRGVVFHRLPN